MNDPSLDTHHPQTRDRREMTNTVPLLAAPRAPDITALTATRWQLSAEIICLTAACSTLINCYSAAAIIPLKNVK